MRVSLRLKFILALLVTSVSAVAMVGLGARWLLLRDFSETVREESFSRYQIGLVAYIKHYGSLERALQAEPFGAFQRRYDAERSARGFPAQSWSAYRQPDPVAARVPQGVPGQWRGPAPMPDADAGPATAGPQPLQDQDIVPGPDTAPALAAMSHPNGGQFVGGYGNFPPPGPPPNPTDTNLPPFKFLLLNPTGTVMDGDASYPVGSMAPMALLAQARPVIVNSQVVALAVPLAKPNLNGLDKAYLHAVSQALLYAGGGAVLLTLLLGVVLGNRLGGELRRLTSAVESMAKGQLRQRVAVESSDEIGVLASAFNRMSEDLAHAHEELQQSAQQVRVQAERMQELSVRDPLTGIHNRRYFDEQSHRLFAEAVRYRQPLTFMVGDLDHFKRINDQFSHAVGDEVLRRVAVLLRSHLRESDVVARYGGEEFVVAFTHTPIAQAAIACEKLRRVIEEYPWHEIAPGLQVTMSMGLCDDLGLPTPGKMLDRADAYLYLAKEEGRNRVAYQPPRAARIRLGAA